MAVVVEAEQAVDEGVVRVVGIEEVEEEDEVAVDEEGDNKASLPWTSSATLGGILRAARQSQQECNEMGNLGWRFRDKRQLLLREELCRYVTKREDLEEDRESGRHCASRMTI